MTAVVSEMQLKHKLSANLKKLLQKMGWSQGDLARAMFSEVSTSQRMIVSRWVRGERLPSAIEMLNLAEVFSVKVEELTRDGDNPPTKKNRKSA